MTKHIVIGGGSWGSAIASSLQRAQQPVTILARSQQTVDMLAQGRCKELPDCAPIAPISATINQLCLADAKVIFVAVPTQANKDSFSNISKQQVGAHKAIIVLCAKGIISNNQGNAMLLTELAKTILPKHKVVVFSGPSFADEVFSGLPAALVAAGNDDATKTLQDSFEGSSLRVYRNTDSVGVALAGAMKNKLAIVSMSYGGNWFSIKTWFQNMPFRRIKAGVLKLGGMKIRYARFYEVLPSMAQETFDKHMEKVRKLVKNI